MWCYGTDVGDFAKNLGGAGGVRDTGYTYRYSGLHSDYSQTMEAPDEPSACC
jgi:hypothetical protein